MSAAYAASLYGTRTSVKIKPSRREKINEINNLKMTEDSSFDEIFIKINYLHAPNKVKSHGIQAGLVQAAWECDGAAPKARNGTDIGGEAPVS